VDEIVVETHSLAAGLDRPTWDSRLGALFSTPFVAAAALVHGHVRPEASAEEARSDSRVQTLAGRVRVVAAPDLDARLPAERAARVTVRTGGSNLSVEVPNPVGDAAHHPFTESDVLALLSGWLADEETVALVREVAADLPGAADVGPLLRRLAG
jgi:2-methylcitrate dehydratase PrpD